MPNTCWLMTTSRCLKSVPKTCSLLLRHTTSVESLKLACGSTTPTRPQPGRLTIVLCCLTIRHFNWSLFNSRGLISHWKHCISIMSIYSRLYYVMFSICFLVDRIFLLFHVFVPLPSSLLGDLCSLLIRFAKQINSHAHAII